MGSRDVTSAEVAIGQAGGKAHPARSRRETLDPPAVAVAGIANAVVEAVGPALPELVAAWQDGVAAPMRRRLDEANAWRFGQTLKLLVQPRAVRDDVALRRDPSAQPRPLGPGLEVRPSRGSVNALYPAAHACLALQIRPVKDGGGAWIGSELTAFFTVVIGVEHELAIVERFGEDDAGRRFAVATAGCEREGVRLGEAGTDCVAEPLRELIVGIGRDR